MFSFLTFLPDGVFLRYRAFYFSKLFFRFVRGKNSSEFRMHLKLKGVMMSASIRQLKIIKVLCRRRHETLDNLAHEFNVSYMTIRRDILDLSTLYPLYTTQGKGGGVHVVDGYELNKSYLPEKHIATFEKMKQHLHGEELDAVEYILKKYKKPERRDN